MAAATTSGTTEDIFKQHKVVPDVIPVAPKQFLKVGKIIAYGFANNKRIFSGQLQERIG